MNRNETLHGLEFKDHRLLDNEVNPAPAVEAYVFVHDWQRHLSPKPDATFPKLVTKTFLVGRLEKSWPKLSVHFYGEADDFFRKGIMIWLREHQIRSLTASPALW